MEYKPTEIEKKWQKIWQDRGTYLIPNNSSKPKYYVLDMFPYPSGAGLHVGHPLGYIASDIFTRYKRLQGFNVLHPMGYDAFGLPAEQYAIQTGVHPADSTEENIIKFRSQLQNIGFSYDWSREIRTSDPGYYKWTQWIFLKLYGHFYNNKTQKAEPIDTLIYQFSIAGTAGLDIACSEVLNFTASDWNNFSEIEKEDILMNYRLGYRKQSYVNWCEELGTVLANDEVKDGVSERGGFPVIKKPMLQWSLRTTAYAQRLLDGLSEVDWPTALKIQQENWIGRSEGAKIFFPVEQSMKTIEVFTTRPDTIFGCTFMVLAPEHEFVQNLTIPERKTEIEEYQKYVKSRSDRERQSEVRNVTGAFTGSYALHPFTGKKVPIWISEYVFADYGSGAIMAVPANDGRDQAFATHFGLPVIEVVDQSSFPNATIEDKTGILINSGFLDGLEVKKAISTVLDKIEEKNIGTRKINFKLRDANFSRQRYWGEPFPVYYDKDGICRPATEKELPVELPDLSDFKPAKDGKSPLSKASQWLYEKEGFIRETDTMPGFAGSSWYYLRYMDPANNDALASKDAINYWQDVDLYIGGSEHAVGHLLYSRTWHKFLYDINVVPTREPFKKLINQGMIQGVSEKLYVSKEELSEIWYWEKEKQEAISVRLLLPRKVIVSGNRVDFYLKHLKDDNAFYTIHVPIAYVKDYGLGTDSYLDNESVYQLISNHNGWEDKIIIGEFSYYNRITGTREESLGPKENKTDNSCFEYIQKDEFKIYTTTEVEKMSKSKYNVINPDDVVTLYGADCFRMYEMFLGPLEQAKPWDTKGIDGVSKFLRRFWSLFYDQNGNWQAVDKRAAKEEKKVLHICIKKVTEDIEKFSFNTCVSAFMICVNDLKKLNTVSLDILTPLIQLISPFAPHIAEELWARINGPESSVFDSEFPVFNPEYIRKNEILYPVAINGKKRTDMLFSTDADPKMMEMAVISSEDIAKWLEGMTIKKVIIVKGRMINIVAS